MAVAVVVLVTVLACVCRKRREEEREGRRKDVNPIYGVYHRGWDGEGDYGHGDISKVIDNNVYYGT